MACTHAYPPQLMGIPLEGFAGTDSGLHLEAERQKLHHLMAFHQLCGNDLYVAALRPAERRKSQ
ncbi:hypothetical protein [Synechococcus sp. MIT S9510]|uniref:hypothetical protein n=2 Tax=Synechococcus TaxID=1129 RepID=UPI0039AF130C